MDRKKSLFYQGRDPPWRRDVPSIIGMPLYGVEWSKKREKMMDFGLGIKNNEVDDEMKEVRNNRAKENIKEAEEFGGKKMNG